MEQVAILPDFICSTSVILYQNKRILLFKRFLKELKRKYRQQEFFPYPQKISNNDLTVVETFSQIQSVFKIPKIFFHTTLTKGTLITSYELSRCQGSSFFYLKVEQNGSVIYPRSNVTKQTISKSRAFQVSIDSPSPEGQVAEYYVRKSPESIMVQVLWALGLVLFFDCHKCFYSPVQSQKTLIKSGYLQGSPNCMIQLYFMLLLQLNSYLTTKHILICLGRCKEGILK